MSETQESVLSVDQAARLHHHELRMCQEVVMISFIVDESLKNQLFSLPGFTGLCDFYITRRRIRIAHGPMGTEH